jgi:hypothetical protein
MSAIHKTWDDQRAEMRRSGLPDETIVDLHTRDLDKLTDYDQHALTEKFMPDYYEMLMLMRKNIWLAEQSTRANLDNLIEYVDTWEMILTGVIRGGVVMNLGHGESKLQPLYTDVEEIHDRLRDELATKRRLAFSRWSNNILHRVRRLIP